MRVRVHVLLSLDTRDEPKRGRLSKQVRNEPGRAFSILDVVTLFSRRFDRSDENRG